MIKEKALINIINENGQNLVSARELHSKLEIGKDFTNWMKKNIEYGFVENVDFTTLWNDAKTGDVVTFNGNVNSMVRLGYQKEYIITLDMAKHICMVLKTQQGKIFRQYFIDVEKQAIKPKMPVTYLEALKELVQAEEQRVLLEAKIEEDKPKVEFVEAIIESDCSIAIGEFAKVLSKRDIKIGQNNLFKLLRDEGFLISNPNQRNLPYQKYLDMGIFEVKEINIDKSTFKGLSFKTLVTPKGQVYLSKKIKEYLGGNEQGE
ncbi:MAG: phage antirepressor KilAC domain-containing protein [Cetobacterium sp.]